MKIRYVYYDKTTGFIKEILKKRKRGRAPYIECDFPEVEGFITGTKGIYQYVVAYDRKQKKNILMERNNVIRFRGVEKDLYKIPNRKNVDSDLTIEYFEDNIIEVSLDISRISPIAQTRYGKEIVFEKGTEIRIIIKAKDTKEIIKEIIIEAQKLLNVGSLLFDIPWYENGIEFHTYKVFENYSWYRGYIKLLSPIKDKIKFDIHKADNLVRDKNFSYHLIGKSIKNGIQFVNNIESLKLIKFREPIEFFVVDKHDPNILYDKFYLGEDELKKKKINLELKESIKGKTLLYNHKYISVLLKG